VAACQWNKMTAFVLNLELETHQLYRRKKSTSPPELWGGVYFTPGTIKQSNLPPELSKTVQIIPSSDFLWRVCYSNNGFVTVTVVLPFSFFLFVFI
jgi:hypothetical protein